MDKKKLIWILVIFTLLFNTFVNACSGTNCPLLNENNNPNNRPDLDLTNFGDNVPFTIKNTDLQEGEIFFNNIPHPTLVKYHEEILNAINPTPLKQIIQNPEVGALERVISQNKEAVDNSVQSQNNTKETDLQPDPKEEPPKTLKSVLDSIQDSISSSKGIYGVIEAISGNRKTEQKWRRALFGTVNNDFFNSLEDPEGSFCALITKPPKPESSVLLKKNQLIPSLQLQALRSSKITYPGYYPEINSILHPDDIDIKDEDTETVDLYYYKITFSLSSLANINGTYEVNLFGKSGNDEYTIDLDPNSNSSTSMHVSSTDTVMVAGSSSILKYWPILLDEVCLKIKDPEYVLKPEFVKNPAIKKEGEFYSFCVPVILGTDAETDAPVGEAVGTTLQ